MRPPFMIKNTDRNGNVMDGKLFVQVGDQSQTWDEESWNKNGLEWFNKALSQGAGQARTAPQRRPKGRPRQSNRRPSAPRVASISNAA